MECKTDRVVKKFLALLAAAAALVKATSRIGASCGCERVDGIKRQLQQGSREYSRLPPSSD